MTIVRVCTPDPSTACAGRYEAVKRGRFWYSDEADGWLWSGAAHVCDRWRTCPWCAGDLPTAASGMRRAADGEQADGCGYEGEDGG